MLTDPLGLVEWNGRMTVTEVTFPAGAATVVFELTSECVNGLKANVEVWGVGPAFGAGIFAGLNYGDVSLNDHYDDIDMTRFRGTVQIYTATLSPGIGLGLYSVRVGEDGGLGSYGIHGSGGGVVFGPGAGVSTMLGSSSLVDASFDQCECTAN